MNKKVTFKHTLGINLCGIIDDPLESFDNPIIIIAHGFTSSKNSSSYKKILENLSKAKISTFRIDLFGHGESGGDFSDITISKGKDSVLSAINYLKSLGYKNIGLFGSSFGGISSIMAASESKDIFCLSLKSPVTNWLDISTVKKEGLLERWKKDGYRIYNEGSFESKLKFDIVEDAKKNIAFDVASNILVPTLIVHGDKDEIVSYEGSVELARLMLNAKLHTVKEANHNYSSSTEHFEEMSEVISKFLIDESKKINN